MWVRFPPPALGDEVEQGVIWFIWYVNLNPALAKVVVT